MSNDNVVWSGGSTNPIATAAAIVFLLLTIGAAASGRVGSALIALVGTLAATPFTQVRMRVTTESVRVALGPWGWPSERHAIADIDWVELDDVDRLEVRLGVGVRGSNRKLTGRAYLLRPGPVVRFQGHMGRRLTVTVDGAAGAVTVIEGLIDPSIDES